MVRQAELEQLTEGQQEYPVDLTLAEAAALNGSGLVTAQAGDDGWRVTAEHAVGAVRRGELLVRVTPKVGITKVLTLLARAHGVRGLKIDPELVDLAGIADLSTVLAVLFAHEAAVAMAAGPIRGYRTEDQTLPVLRGRLRLREQHLRRFGLLIPLEVTLDEWTLDTDDNRRLRAAATALLALPEVPAPTLRALMRLDRLLTEVVLPTPGATLAPWTPTRLNVRMHNLLHLADVVLAHTSVEHLAGQTQTHGFIVDMAWLFETLVARLLEEETSEWESQETFSLETLDRLSIRPDLVLHDGTGVVAVAETKYKLLDEDGRVPNADVYQLVTYCARLGLRTGHLVYASDEPPPEPFDIVGSGVHLDIHAIDLTQPLVEIEQKVRQLSRKMAPHANVRVSVAG